jgi:hypothetical protein
MPPYTKTNKIAENRGILDIKEPGWYILGYIIKDHLLNIA